MSTPTTRFAFAKPTVGGSLDNWGDLLNANWDQLDGLLQSQAQIINFIYPIGSVIIRADAVNPATYLPGTTWVLDAQDRAIVGAGGSHALGATFGADEYSLTLPNIPSHDHSFAATSTAAGAHNHTANTTILSGGGHSHTFSTNTSNTGSHAHGAGTYVTDNAGNHTHQVFQQIVSRDTGALGSGHLVRSTPSDHAATTEADGAHSHEVNGTSGNAGAHSHSVSGTTAAVLDHNHNANTNLGPAVDHTHDVSGTTGTAGSATVTPIPLDQPSKVFNIWRRTA